MDADTRATIEGLNEALQDSGLTQAAFAAALGTSASRFSTYRSGKTMPTAAFYLRARRIAASLRGAGERGWMTSLQASRAISSAIAEGDELWAYKMSLQARDHLHEILATDQDLSGAWEAAPGSTGQIEWDVFLGALTAHAFEVAGEEPPRWTRGLELDHEWLLASPLLDDDEVRRETPRWLARRGVFVSERDLVTA